MDNAAKNKQGMPKGKTRAEKHPDRVSGRADNALAGTKHGASAMNLFTDTDQYEG